MIITRKSVNRHIIMPLHKKGYKIELVGSILKKGYSNKDIDLLLFLPKYPDSDKIFIEFEKELRQMGWCWFCDDETNEYGLFHNYEKKEIGLDIFINEAV